jgi:hypothetical protein
LLGIDSGFVVFLFFKSYFKKGDEMKKIAAFFVLSLLFLNIAGCAPLIIGAAVGAVGGYAVSKDTVQGETDKPYEDLWNAALTVSKIRGTLIAENYPSGTIELDVKPTKVWIRLIRLTQATTRIRISARRYHFPNLELAQDLFVKIMEQAK